MVSLAVILLTHNESLHIARALKSVEAIAREVFVVDSGSTDQTVEIARAAGATVLVHDFVNYSEQFRWALENAPITSDWVMRLDADEIVEADLAGNLTRQLPALPAEVSGINIKRKYIFMGRWIRYGGRYPMVMLRIWRRGKASIEDRWMDEHMVLKEGRAITIEGGFVDHNLNDLTYFTAKHNNYATREAIDFLVGKHRLGAYDVRVSAKSVSLRAAATRWIKENVYNKMPFWLGATAYFFYRYVLRLGFLDGREGAIYHYLQGYWYRFLVGAKACEYERLVGDFTDHDRALLELGRVTGYDLSSLK